MDFILRKNLYILSIHHNWVWFDVYVFNSRDDACLYITSQEFDEENYQIKWKGEWCDYRIRKMELIEPDIS